MKGRSAFWKVVSVLLIAALCVLAFLVPSAWIIARDQPHWLAAIAGGLTFPLLPVGWHLLAERRRRRDAKKSALTGTDRFMMRVMLVAAIAVAPLVILARGQTWAAVKDHGTWPLDWASASSNSGSSAGARDAALLDYVPADAEALLWVRGDGGKTDDGEAGEALIALRRGGLLIVARGGDQEELKKLTAADLRKELRKQQLIGPDWFGLDRQELSVHAFGAVSVVTTENWNPGLRARRDGGPPPAALVDALAHVPADAPMAVVARPQGPVLGLPIESASGWVRVGDERFRAYASLLAGTPEDAETVRVGVVAGIGAARAKVPAACRAQSDAVLNEIEASATGREVRATLDMKSEKLGELVMCAVAEAMDDLEFEEDDEE
ncbi:MAG TPA: hypothetical protein VML75_09170 [Kofleriaceae bacterium]|nr:hypothetical protein [Kofleriaceae bacterium]